MLSKSPIEANALISKPEAVSTVNSGDAIINKLFEAGAVNFSQIAACIILGTMSRERLVSVQNAAVKKVIDTLIAGNFADLRGAKDLLLRLDLQDLTVADEVMAELNSLLPRLNEITLIHLGLSQPVVVGEYDLTKARKILIKSGFKDGELDDEQVKKILDFRHILMELKRRSIAKIDSLPNLLKLSE
jgi:hypothetical protein